MKLLQLIQSILNSTISFPINNRFGYFIRIVLQMMLNLLDVLALSLIALSFSGKNSQKASFSIHWLTPILSHFTILIAICSLLFVLKGLLSLQLLKSNSQFLSRIASETAVQDFYQLQKLSIDKLEDLDRSKVTRMFLRGYEDTFLILYSSIPTLLTESILVILISIVVFFISPINLIVVVLLFFGAVIYSYKLMAIDSELTGKEYANNATSMMNALSEQFTMSREYRLLGVESLASRRFADSFENMTKAKSRYLTLIGFPKYLLEVILFTFIFIILVVQEIFVGGVQSIELGVFLAGGLRLLPSLLRINNSITQIQSAYSSNQNLNDLIFVSPDTPKMNLESKTIVYSEKLESVTPLISMRNLTFSHSSQSSTLCFPDLDVLEGECVALVGKSGSGKSTLLDLICGFLTPSSGSISINGFLPSDFVASNPKKIALIPQLNNIIEGDLLDNIALFDEVPDREKAFELAKALNLDNLIERDSRDFITNSNQLSGGQKQRICIARALYFEPKILIFDEATSALDEINASVVLELIFDLRRDMTVIFSTHDRNHTKYFDRVIEIS